VSPRRRLAFAALVLLPALTSCHGGSHSAQPAAPAAAKPQTLVTIGDSATEGDGVADRFRRAWPYLLFDDSFAPSSTLVNAALDGATAANARLLQEPVAKEVKADVVAIWLGAVDVARRTAIAPFGADLRKLLDDLRHAGVRRILVADLPAAYAGAAPYNAAIRSVTAATKSTLVELGGAAISFTANRGLPDQPDTASHQVIAAAFEHALQSTP
jgi:lysophospholipase L1-like esterase